MYIACTQGINRPHVGPSCCAGTFHSVAHTPSNPSVATAGYAVAFPGNSSSSGEAEAIPSVPTVRVRVRVRGRMWYATRPLLKPAAAMECTMLSYRV